MKPEIIEKESFKVIGMKYVGKNQNGEISKLWNQFLPRCKEIKNRLNHEIAYGYETYTEECQEIGEFTYVAGVEVSSIDEVPEGMVSYEVPKNTYAVFTLDAFIEKLPSQIGNIYSKLLAENNLEPVGNYDFEYYTPEFHPNKKDAKLYFFVPIKK